MHDDDYGRLLEDLEYELLSGGGPAGVLGLTRVTLRLLASLTSSGLVAAVEGVYTPTMPDGPSATRGARATIAGAQRSATRRARSRGR
jgi:hypothetical protein